MPDKTCVYVAAVSLLLYAKFDSLFRNEVSIYVNSKQGIIIKSEKINIIHFVIPLGSHNGSDNKTADRIIKLGCSRHNLK